MKNVVIAGASGVVGRRVLDGLLAREDVQRVVALGRRTLPIQHHKLVSTVVDLQDRAAITNALMDAPAVAICCLGTTIKQAGSRAAFRALDLDAVVTFAEGALDKGAKRFLLVTSLGSDARSANFYLRTKGEVEEAVERLGYAQLTVVRPSFIDDEGARTERRFGERMALPAARAIFSIVGKTSRYAPVTATAIGKALVRLAFDDTTERVRTVESEQLHLLGR